MSENIVEFMCESEDLEKACLLFSASKKRTFVVVQISPAVRVSIGEYFGFYRGEDAVGKLVSALTLLGADAVVDSAIAFDAVTLMRAKALKQAKENGKGAPMYSSECAKWVEFAKAQYPDVAAGFLPSATSMCAKLVKKYYGKQVGDKKVRVVALEMGDAKKTEAGVDVVLTLQELAELLDATAINVRMMPKTALDMPFGVGSGAGYLAAVSGGDAEALARCFTADKTQKAFRKFGYSGLYDNKARREVCLNLDGMDWNFAVVDSLEEAAAVIADVDSGEKSYDYVEVTACAGGQVGVGCDLDSEDGMMTKRLRKLGLQYLDMARAARSADVSSAAELVVKEWTAMCRSGEAAAYDVIDEIVEDYDEEEIIEPVVEEVSGPVVEMSAVEEIIEETPAEEVIEEIVEETPVEETVVEEETEEIVEETLEEVIEETPVEEVIEEIVEPVVEEVPAEEVIEEPAVTVSKEEVEAEMSHVEELLMIAVEDLTPAQKAARNIYYRRLSTKDRRKLKRAKNKQRKN